MPGKEPIVLHLDTGSPFRKMWKMVLHGTEVKKEVQNPPNSGCDHE